jgi:hypothetical protein
MDDHDLFVLNECFSASINNLFRNFLRLSHFATFPHTSTHAAKTRGGSIQFKSSLFDKRLGVTNCFSKNTSMATERYYLLSYEGSRVCLFNNNSCLTQSILHIHLDQRKTKSTQTFPIVCGQTSYMTCFRYLPMITINSLKT